MALPSRFANYDALLDLLVDLLLREDEGVDVERPDRRQPVGPGFQRTGDDDGFDDAEYPAETRTRAT